jgi:GNAT superfamily N-acetyltransferase
VKCRWQLIGPQKRGGIPDFMMLSAFGLPIGRAFLSASRTDSRLGVFQPWRYGTMYGFLGFYIVRPEWRRHGYGLQLWQAAMKQMAGRVVGLDGVLAQQENYRKSGFKLAYRNIRYSGKIFRRYFRLITGSKLDLSIVPANK